MSFRNHYATDMMKMMMNKLPELPLLNYALMLQDLAKLQPETFPITSKLPTDLTLVVISSNFTLVPEVFLNFSSFHKVANTTRFQCFTALSCMRSDKSRKTSETRIIQP